MSHIHLLLLTLLLCNGFFDEIAARHEILDKNGKLNQESIDLDGDELLRIFKSFNLNDLVTVASTNSRVASIAAKAYRITHEEYEVKIWQASSNCIKAIDFSGMKRIEITGYELALDFLKYFGDEIKELLITEGFKQTILENIKEPLKQIEHLHYTIEYKQDGSKILPLNQMFPKLHGLTLHLRSDSYFGFIDCELPQIDDLRIHLSNNAWNQKNYIEGLIQKNAHIKSIEINGFPADYIKVINKLLPNLGSLILCDQKIDTGKEIVQFEHVKNLEIISMSFC